jgi:hypothetical protein
MKSLQEIAEIVETEGLETAVLEEYIKPEDFEDRELSLAVENARNALLKIDNALYDLY